MAWFCDELLSLLWQTAWQSTMVLILVLLLWGIFGKWLTNRWKHALWGLLLLRLLLPALPQNRFSLYSLAELFSRVDSSSPSSISAPIAPAATIFTVIYGPVAKVTPTHAQRKADAPPPVPRVPQLLVAIWLLIAVSLFAYRVVANHRFVRRVKQRARNCAPRLIDALQAARLESRVVRTPGLILTDLVEAPAVMGALRPRILLPTALPDRLSDEQLRLVLLHELSHIKCGDIAIDWLWAMALSLHWFNPLLWIISPLRRNDREMARDEMVLHLAGAQQASCYGQMLIELARTPRLLPLCPGLVGMANGAHGLTRRISSIARFDQRRASFSVVGFGLMIAAGCGALTSPKPPVVTKPAAVKPATNPVAAAEITQRHYVVNDYLFIPPDYTNAPDLGLKDKNASGSPPFSKDSPPAAPPPDRESRAEELRKYIIDNVDPDSWKENGGAVGSISADAGRTIFSITQTAANQERIQALLDGLRASGERQVSIETRIFHLDEAAEKKLPGSLRQRLAAVRYAGRYRRDEFLTGEQVAQMIRTRDEDWTKEFKTQGTSGSVTAPRLTLFNSQHAVLVVATQQAYVADLVKVVDKATGNWHYDPQVKTVTAEGIVLKVLACSSPDNTSVFVDLHDETANLLGLLPEQYGPGHPSIVGTIQRPVLAMFHTDAACGIPVGSTLLLGGSETIDSCDPKFNADSPDRVKTDAAVKKMREDENQRHWYVLIKPTILKTKAKPAAAVR